ncbi:MAG: helix-turn-helix transcriptional regulator [Treponema sp.]|nr:helix-turn-helix transcriptional regulator [Treponema sp.]
MKELYGYEYSKTCPLVYALTVVGARWKLPIIWYLTEEDGLHYNELRRRVQGITDTALARALHELENDGILTRRDAKTMPMSVTYHLTDLGKKLMPALNALYGWGEEHRANAEKCKRSGGNECVKVFL